MSPLLRKSAEHYKAFGVSMWARIKAEWNYKKSIKSHTILLRPDGVHLNIDKDYGLSKVGVLYQEQGTLHFFVRYSVFNGCGYCGYCTLADVATVAFELLYWHNTSADVAAVVFVLLYWHNTLTDVATVVVVLRYLHNT
jgi:hypothetical protein